MEYRKIEGLDKKVSRIIFGSATRSFLKGEDCDLILDKMAESGINTIDTARGYGLSENVIGSWMRRRGNRDDMVIISKCAHHDHKTGKKRVTREDIRYDLEKSLEALSTDHIDIYMLHRDDEDIPVSDIIKWMNELKEEGKIKVIGVSNWSVERLIEANEYASKSGLSGIGVFSPHYSLAEQLEDIWGGGCVTITGKENIERRKLLADLEIPVLAYSPLGRGLLSGKLKSADGDKASEFLDRFAVKGYVSENNIKRLERCEELSIRKNSSVSNIAVSYLLLDDMNVFPILSMSSEERIKENTRSLDIEITEEERKYLNLEI